MPNSTFELFEAVCGELVTRDSFVLTERLISTGILEDLKNVYKKTVTEQALSAAMQAIADHFKAREAKLPFTYDPTNMMATATDKEYLKYVTEAREIRGNPKKARDFEVAACNRLSKRLNLGAFHHTGWPR